MDEPTAHRVLVLAEGRITATGSYDDLIDTSPAFRAFVHWPAGAEPDTAPVTSQVAQVGDGWQN
ncbi:hypothetical protein ACIBIZ_35845 [Nonomuraea spiralis]|uniref:hypothetical protein n=1 Tax=Nonomuraea spiralis TaxID=46182 RepID=UPI0037B59D1E